MTLEDFFTLTEMKDGLTAPSRVQELVTVMQSEKDSVVNNIGDATRQWAAVASTIAATENKDCLDLFIQLDGLMFVDRWLKDAKNLGKDTNENFVEESITALLRALEKLHIHNKRSLSSGIWSTVKSLLSHKSSTVQDQARLLFDSWKEDGDAVQVDVVNAGVLPDDGSSKILEEDSKPSALNVTSEVGDHRENHSSGPAENEVLPIRTSGDHLPESADTLPIQPCNKQSPPIHKLLDSDYIKDESPDTLASAVVFNPIQENPIKDESSMCSVGGTTSIGISTFPVAKLSSMDEQSDGPKLNELSKNENQDHKANSSPKKLGVTDISSGSGLLEPGSVYSGADGAASQDVATDSALQKHANLNDSCQKFTALGSEGTTTSDPKGVMDDPRSVNHCSTTVQEGECCSDTAQDSSGNGSISGKIEDLETSSKMAIDEDQEHSSDEDEELTIANEYPKPAIDAKSPDTFDKRSDIELEYGMVDALEVARRVAQEYVREELDCSSSSEKNAEGGLRQANSPDSINAEQELPVSPKEAPTEQSHSAEANPEREDHMVNSENPGTAPYSHSPEANPDMESSQVTEAVEEPEVNPEKGLCSFDLNQEVCSNELDRPENPVSTPIPVSRPVAAASLPGARLQFEGAIGWIGSAPNSAFRRASPRRLSDGDKSRASPRRLSDGDKNLTGATSDSSKQRQDYLDIDLNVAEGGDDLGKQIPASSGLPSGESSVEVNQNRSGRPHLDLNRIDDDDADALPSDSRVEGQFLFNCVGRRSPSPASSSSSIQPCMRNFDLNDRPFFHNDSVDHGPGKSFQNANAYGWPKQDASVISIMGTRVQINGKDASQNMSLANGKAIETATEATMARTRSFMDMGSTFPYSHPPVFSYNGLATGPAMSFSSAVYGSGGAIPYLVDSRGAPVVPQIMASPLAVPRQFSQSPFIMNLTGAQPGPNGVINGAGPSRPGFDLNSGFMVEGGNRDSVGPRQLFIHGQGRSMEDHLRNNSQPPSSSTVGGKRKEPDGGWEPYPYSYRQQQQPPPWR